MPRETPIPLEVTAKRTRMLNLTRGETTDGVAVRWRVVGQRRWSSFLLIPDDDQTLDDLFAHADEVARKVYEAQR